MATVAQLERVDYGSDNGCLLKGNHCNVIQSVGAATRTLVGGESGSLCLFDRAAGIVYTLPAPVVGMNFDFLVTVAITTNAAKIITDASTTFLVGGIIAGDVTIATSGDYFEADGTTIRALSANGSTSGGLLGERYTVTAISTTQWVIHGVTHGAGTLITPFATS